MSGEHPRDDEPDFLDDDFVLEDDAAFGDLPEEDHPKAAPDGDLDDLFAPAAPVRAEGGTDDADADDLDQDLFAVDEVEGITVSPTTSAEEEEILFTDHTADLDTAPTFVGGGDFGESSGSQWNGDGLELEDTPEAEALTPAHIEEATADFEQELSSMMIEEEDDLVVDSEQDLELVDAPVSTGRPAVSAEPSFDLDGGFDELPTLEPLDEDDMAPVAAELSADSLSLVEEEEPIHPDWAPLDEAALAQEAEEVANPYAEEYYAEDEVLDEAEGHDLYVEDEEEVAEVVGGNRRSGRMLSMFASLAASLAILASGAVVVMRPEWFGLSFAPERVPSAQVTRPEVKVTVSAPALPPLPAEPVVTTPTTVPPGGAETEPVTPSPVEPAPVTPTNGGTGETQPTPVEQPAPIPVPIEPTPAGQDTVVVQGAEPVPVDPSPSPEATSPVEPAFEGDWPVPVVAKGQDPKALQSQLVRINDHVLLGDSIKMAPRPAQAVDGMVPGARAFAQLHNGNYFIGSVKTMDVDTLTLKVDNGEVSIPVVSIARLTQLGSQDFEELQKMTTGSVRLTNNNRLVGSILSGIADDHVVLEFRSNRVMLPKSVIGDILEGQEQSDVRLDTTREEDDWLRRLIERELGTGLGAPVATPPTKPAATPAATPPANPQAVPPATPLQGAIPPR